MQTDLKTNSHYVVRCQHQVVKRKEPAQLWINITSSIQISFVSCVDKASKYSLVIQKG